MTVFETVFRCPNGTTTDHSQKKQHHVGAHLRLAVDGAQPVPLQKAINEWCMVTAFKCDCGFQTDQLGGLPCMRTPYHDDLQIVKAGVLADLGDVVAFCGVDCAVVYRVAGIGSETLRLARVVERSPAEPLPVPTLQGIQQSATDWLGSLDAPVRLTRPGTDTWEDDFKIWRAANRGQLDARAVLRHEPFVARPYMLALSLLSQRFPGVVCGTELGAFYKHGADDEPFWTIIRADGMNEMFGEGKTWTMLPVVAAVLRVGDRSYVTIAVVPRIDQVLVFDSRGGNHSASSIETALISAILERGKRDGKPLKAAPNNRLNRTRIKFPRADGAQQTSLALAFQCVVALVLRTDPRMLRTDWEKSPGEKMKHKIEADARRRGSRGRQK